MRNIRRRTAAVATVATLALALTACSSGGDDDTSGDEATSDGVTIGAEQSVGAMTDFAVGTTFKATEPVEFSMMYRDHPNYPVKDDWAIFEELAANQNVTFSRTDIPLADWDQKKALLIGAGDAPQIIPLTYPGQEVQYVSGGSILPISDYVEYLPNFRQKVEDWGLQDEIDTHRQADGKYYLLPGMREVPDVQYSVVVNEAMWQNAGITEDPETWEDFAADLEKVKAANPSLTYAFSDRWTDTTPLGALMQYMAPNYGTVGGWGYSNTFYNQDSGEFELTGTTDAYKDMVTQVADMVASGAMDPEITQSDDQAIQKFVSGQTAAISGNTQEINNYRSKAPDLAMRLIVIPDGPAGGNLPSGQLAAGQMISADAAEDPHFLAMLQFIDWLYYSDEGLEFAQWGVEGTTYTKDGSGVRTLQPDIGWNALNPGAPKKLNADFGFSNGIFMPANGASKELLQSVMSQEVKDWTNAVLAKKEVLPVAPAASLDELELEQTSLLDTQIKDAVYAATANFVSGQRPLSDWDAYVSEIQGLGADQLIDTFNTALARAES